MTSLSEKTRPIAHGSAAVARANETAAAVTLLEALPAACAVFCREDGLLRYANSAFRHMFGSGGSISRVHVFEARFQRFAQSVAATADVMPGPKESGGHLYEAFEPASNNWFSMHWSDFDWGDDVSHTIVMATNTSASHAAEHSRVSERERLLFTSRMMSVGEMASTIAHELNQPLAAIINYLNVAAHLQRDAADQEKILSAVTMAQSQAEHASAVVSHLREFVHAREPRRQAHPIAMIVAKVLELTELDLQQNLVTLNHQCEPGLPPVYVDAVMIEQVLLNLIRNAIAAMREVHPMRRRIRVDAGLNLDGDVEVSVTDTGCGVTPTQEKRLFEPLYTTKPDGLGIGLAICRSILEYHDGRLYFERDPQARTVFAITLPISQAQGE